MAQLPNRAAFLRVTHPLEKRPPPAQTFVTSMSPLGIKSIGCALRTRTQCTKGSIRIPPSSCVDQRTNSCTRGQQKPGTRCADWERVLLRSLSDSLPTNRRIERAVVYAIHRIRRIRIEFGHPYDRMVSKNDSSIHRGQVSTKILILRFAYIFK